MKRLRTNVWAVAVLLLAPMAAAPAAPDLHPQPPKRQQQQKYVPGSSRTLWEVKPAGECVPAKRFNRYKKASRKGPGGRLIVGCVDHVPVAKAKTATPAPVTKPKAVTAGAVKP